MTNILATICARGGSKGLKNKNIRKLNGKPLIYYTIDILKKWGKFDRLICSTDSKKIAKVVRNYDVDVPFLRPKYLAKDDSPKLPVIKHALKYCEKVDKKKFDIIIDLDPTSPIRTTTDIDRALKKFRKKDIDLLYSVTKARKNPYFNMVELDNQGYAHLSKRLENDVYRRQDAPKVYAMNASIYVYDRSFLLDSKGLYDARAMVYEMNDLSSFDIDRKIDFDFIEFLIKRRVFQFE